MFNEKFTHSETCALQRFENFEKKPFTCYCQLKEIKSFIRSLLSKSRKEAREEVIERIERIVKKEKQMGWTWDKVLIAKKDLLAKMGEMGGKEV